MKIKIEYEKGAGVGEKFVLWLLDKGGFIHYYLKPKQKPWGLYSAQFFNFPAGSLGHTLGQFYKSHGYEPVPRAERHDVFHVLFGYNTLVPDEARMQFFLWGNGKTSPFTVGTCFICLMVFPRQIATYINEFKKGRQYTNLSKLNFYSLLNTPLSTVQYLITKKLL